MIYFYGITIFLWIVLLKAGSLESEVQSSIIQLPSSVFH